MTTPLQRQFPVRLPIGYICPHCGLNASLIQDLQQIPVSRLEDGQVPGELVVQLEDGYVDRDGVIHAEVVLTLPRGADEEFVSALAEKDTLKAQDDLLLCCIKRFGSLPKAALEAYGIKILRNLTLGDRQRILQTLNGQIPRANFLVVVHCDHCEADFETLTDITHFFPLS